MAIHPSARWLIIKLGGIGLIHFPKKHTHTYTHTIIEIISISACHRLNFRSQIYICLN